MYVACVRNGSGHVIGANVAPSRVSRQHGRLAREAWTLEGWW